MVYCKGSTLGVLQRQWINGHGSVQAINGNCCIYAHEIRGVDLCALATNNKYCCKSWAWLMIVVVELVVALSYPSFLNFTSYVIQSGSDPDDFKASLTRVTQH